MSANWTIVTLLLSITSLRLLRLVLPFQYYVSSVTK